MIQKPDTVIFGELSYSIIGCAMEVFNTLGYGFLEKVYENALMISFEEKKIKASQQKDIKVFFKGRMVGDYCADILVEDKIILELKSAECLCNAHHTQTLNYLYASQLPLAILINFGPHGIEHKRYPNKTALSLKEFV